MQCCDCGLIHRMNFRILRDKGGRQRIQMQGFRLDTHEEEAEEAAAPSTP